MGEVENTLIKRPADRRVLQNAAWVLFWLNAHQHTHWATSSVNIQSIRAIVPVWYNWTSCNFVRCLAEMPN